MNTNVDRFQSAWLDWLAEVQGQGLLRRVSSQTVYTHMWQALAHWACQQGLAPLDLKPGHLHSYLAERGGADHISLRYAWRLIHLLDRVLAQQCSRQGLPAPTSCAEFLARRPDIRYANASSADDLPDVLAPAQAALLLRHLRRGLRVQAEAPPSDWQRLRNLTATALHFGAGISPGSLRTIGLNHVGPPQSGNSRLRNPAIPIRLLATGNSPAHTAIVDRWALRYLQLWLRRRAECAIPGQVLLPSTRSTGKPWGKVSHYEAIKKVLIDAGLPPEEGGSYRLRHSYALYRLGQGMPTDELQRRLGVSDPKVIERYQALLLSRIGLPAREDSAGVQS